MTDICVFLVDIYYVLSYFYFIFLERGLRFFFFIYREFPELTGANDSSVVHIDCSGRKEDYKQ